ncbi:MAG: ribosome maturation factor RimM [Propionibacteriaceae bacterium]|jgi:16S rRNA processing protein RimM|nr:ribosome maturation factor RimM [Propionibacteriaceae bacterium]
MATVDVLVGVVGRARGLQGESFIAVRTDSPQRRFAPGAVVWVGDHALTVRRFVNSGPRSVISFLDVTDRDGAEALTGEQLWAKVDTEESGDDPQEFFDHQLVGLAVQRWDPDVSDEARLDDDVEISAVPFEGAMLDASTPAVIGTVTRVEHLGFQDMLVIDVDGQERLVPFVNDLVPVVDLAAGIVAIRAVPGLLDDGPVANRPEASSEAEQ